MSLTLIATPIGNSQDIGFRALEKLKKADVIIVEEFKECSLFLRSHGISGKEMFNLNEHSSKEDVAELVGLCEQKEVALITDCGTPGFCDPGADLIAACRKKTIPVDSIPGASSLMTLLSLSSTRLDQFLFRGFLPAENEQREKAWLELRLEKRAVVILDTPYRFGKMIDELKKHLPDRRLLLGVNLTAEDQIVWEGRAEKLTKEQFPKKAEFILLIYPV